MANAGAVQAVDTQHARAVALGSWGNHQRRGADPTPAQKEPPTPQVSTQPLKPLQKNGCK